MSTKSFTVCTHSRKLSVVPLRDPVLPGLLGQAADRPPYLRRRPRLASGVGSTWEVATATCGGRQEDCTGMSIQAGSLKSDDPLGRCNLCSHTLSPQQPGTPHTGPTVLLVALSLLQYAWAHSGLHVPTSAAGERATEVSFSVRLFWRYKKM